MSDDYYSEYVESRKPHERTNGMISRWHARMFQQTIKETGLDQEVRILEIGAGHGQFADYVTSIGHEYNFVDLSPAVAVDMKNKGFTGVCAELQNAPDSMCNYEVVWLSHVLEHCESPQQAASLIHHASRRCAHNGFVVVVSPDAASYGSDFFASDWSHGYPTFRRNVVQIMKEAGLEVRVSKYHRGGHFVWLARVPFAVIARIPTVVVDFLVSRKRVSIGEGYFYSWKTILGWRQIFIVARRQVNS